MPAAFVGRVITVAVLSAALCAGGVAPDFGSPTGLPASEGAAVATVATLPGVVLTSTSAGGVDPGGLKASYKASLGHRFAVGTPSECGASGFHDDANELLSAILRITSARAPPSLFLS